MDTPGQVSVAVRKSRGWPGLGPRWWPGKKSPSLVRRVGPELLPGGDTTNEGWGLLPGTSEDLDLATAGTFTATDTGLVVHPQLRALRKSFFRGQPCCV